MSEVRFDRDPVLAICGWSGSGKTTVLERVVSVLVEKGFRVAVVKHDAHGVAIDQEGKDSARLFAAGADVLLRSPGEQMWRSHTRTEITLERAVLSLLGTHDFILVEGHKDTPLPKIWCHSQSEEKSPEGISGIITTLSWDDERVSTVLSVIDQRIEDALFGRSRFGGVLVGGKSLRMGSPKHMVCIGGRSLLSRVAVVLRPKVEQIVLLGRGAIPEDVGPMDQLGDAPGATNGPMAGLMTAFRWAPRVCWVVCACDMPGISVEAVDWVISHRRTGRWAVIPRDIEGRLHPTLALYEPQAGSLIDDLGRRGRGALRALAEWPEVHTPTIPAALSRAWLNVNTPEELGAFWDGN